MAKEKKGLGTGLGVLFGEDDFSEAESELMTLPISKVEPRKEQPREYFDEAALQDLADSIEQFGLIQPIVARKLDSGYYQIIAGERRWRASRMAGLKEVPVRVIEADDRRTAELALVENLQREDLNPIEEALPGELIKSRRVSSFRVIYHRSVKYGDPLTLRTKRTGSKWLTGMYVGGKLYCAVEVSERKEENA